MRELIAHTKALFPKAVSMVTRSLADYVTARAVWICSWKMNTRVKPPELSMRLTSKSQDWLFSDSPEICEIKTDLNITRER